MTCPSPEQEKRIRDLERDLALERQSSESAEKKFDEINETMKVIAERVEHIDRQTSELQTVRRVLRWSTGTIIAAVATSAAVFKTWFKAEGS